MIKKQTTKLMTQCPRFLFCSVPICPLDIDQDRRDYLPGEPKCTLAKSIRYRIGKDTELPLQGLTKREWSGKQTWDALSDSEKQRRISILRGF